MIDRLMKSVRGVWGILLVGLAGTAIGLFPSTSNALDWSGYFSAHYENEVFEDKQRANGSFDAFALALIPRVDITPQLDLYAQIVFEHGGYFEFDTNCAGAGEGPCARSINQRSSGELTLNDVYITYTFNDMLKVRAGKFATPFGLWNTLQYAAPTHVTVRQPGRESLYSRGSNPPINANFFGRYSQGVWLLGEFAPLSYDLYVANGRTRDQDHKDDNENKAVGGRLRGTMDLGPSKIKLLYSRYQDRLRDTYSAATNPFVDQSTNAVSVEFSLGEFGLTSEYAMSKRGEIKKNGYYAVAQYTLFEKWTPFIQYESYEPNKDSDGDKLSTASVGTVFHIVPWRTMVKLQADQVDREDPPAPAAEREDSRKYWVGFATAF